MSEISLHPRPGLTPANARIAPGCALGLPPSAPLMEICPAASTDASAVFGFALAWALMHARGLIVWAFPDHLEAEHGQFHAAGFAQFGASLERILFVRTSGQVDALWATEQALNIPGAMALCTIAPSPKHLSLTASRRLLLLAEKHRSACVLARLDTPSASAAWARFSVQSAPSDARARELGAPAFDVRLTRNRTRPAGQAWRLIWNAYEHALIPVAGALDGDLAAAVSDRPPASRLRYAI